MDVGTSGPDLARGIYPLVKVVTLDGTADVNDERNYAL